MNAKLMRNYYLFCRARNIDLLPMTDEKEEPHDQNVTGATGDVKIDVDCTNKSER